MSGMDAMTSRIADSFERLSGPIQVVSLFLTFFLAYSLIPLPAFTTDLESFAPETEADEATDRIEEAVGAAPNLVYVNVEANASGDQLPNVMEMKALHQLAVDH